MLTKKSDLDILKKIHSSIENNTDFIDSLGIMSGVTGIIIFQFLYSKLTNSTIEYNKGKTMINIAIKKIDDGNTNPTYHSGIAGFCWGLQFLEDTNIIKLSLDSFLPQFDDFLFEALLKSLKDNEYDFLYGSIGYGVYFLKRYKKTTDKNLRAKYKKYIEKLISYFDRTKITGTNLEVKWKLPKKNNFKNSIDINLGLAHGIPSIIYFLSLVYESNLCVGQIKPLLNKASTFLLSTKINHTNSISLFPTQISQLETKKNVGSRLAWCYGDLGIGISILKAAEVTKNLQLKNKALHILKHSSCRRDLKENRILDTSICHGAFGVSQIFGRLYKKTRIIEFYNASIYWKEIGKKMIILDTKSSTLYAAFSEKNELSKSCNLLNGFSGIGLCLISHLTNFKARWDECLFIS